MSARSNASVRVSKNVHSKGMAETPAVLKVGQALDEYKKIRECLGAAVIMRWGTLPDPNPTGALRSRDFPRRPHADSSVEGPDRALSS